ncbi:MAG: ABC transporter permease [Actinomycetota bacterium]
MCAVLAIPAVYLTIRSAEAQAATWDLIVRPRTLALAGRSILLAAAVTVAAIGVGLPLAWVTTKTDLPLRRLWAVLAPVPLVVPSYVGAFILLSALGPRGLLQGLLEPLGVDRLPDIAGFPGAFLALTLFTYPYVYLLAASAIRGLDPSLEDAARSLGHSRWRTFRRVTLPLLRPSIAAGGLLVALYTLHDFGAVSLMRYQTFTQAIYLQYRAALDRTPAAILSLMLIGVALAVLVMERRARGRARYYRTGTGTARAAAPVPLGRWRWVAVALCATVALLGVALPVSVMLFWLIRGGSSGVALDGLGPAALNSLVAGGAGAALAVAAGLPIALLAARYPGWLARLAEMITYSAYALPGIVVALALVFFGANVTPTLYQKLPLLLVAYVVLFLPQAAEALRGALLQVSPRLEEAARILGRGRWQVLRRVVAPLIARGALTGFALVFLTTMKELPATLLLRPTGFDTLATEVWTASSVGRFGEASVPALLLIGLSAVPLYLMARRVEIQEVRAE